MGLIVWITCLQKKHPRNRIFMRLQRILVSSINLQLSPYAYGPLPSRLAHVGNQSPYITSWLQRFLPVSPQDKGTAYIGQWEEWGKSCSPFSRWLLLLRFSRSSSTDGLRIFLIGLGQLLKSQWGKLSPSKSRVTRICPNYISHYEKYKKNYSIS